MHLSDAQKKELHAANKAESLEQLCSQIEKAKSLKQIQYIPEEDPDKIQSKINLIDAESKSDAGISL